MSATEVTVQAALLYTAASGERLIRVHTMILPVTESVTQMLESADIDCAVNVASKQAVDLAQKTGMESARSRLHQTCVDILRAAKGGGAQPGYGHAPAPQQQLPIPASLQLSPLYIMSLQKNVAIRGRSGCAYR